MTAIDALDVWYRGRDSSVRLVGRLRRDDLGRIGFAYDARWRRDRFAISCSLPLAEAEFGAALGTAHRFFANLLPEADARDQIVRTLRIPNTDFDLLRAIAGECAGALAARAAGSHLLPIPPIGTAR